MEKSELHGLLRDEYLQLQKTVEDFDQRALTIKAWSVTFSSAGLATGSVTLNSLLFLISAIGALAFWIVEALWKTNQQAHYSRVWEIERYFRDEGLEKSPEIKPFSIGLTWSSAFRANGQYKRAFRVFSWPHVALPHAIIVATGIALCVLT